jgi:hypothetical protein
MKGRMEDWLRLLDFSVESSGSSFFQVPLQRAVLAERRGLMERLCGNRFLPVGAYYCILAKKRVYSRLQRRPTWQGQKVTALPGRGAVGASRGYPGHPENGRCAILKHKHVEEY